MTDHWHHATLRLIPDDLRVDSVISAELHATRAQAHAAMQQLLDRLAQDAPQLARLAETWRAGARDDWVYAGTLSFTTFECQPGCARGVQAFLDDYAATLRAAGLRNITVARLAAGDQQEGLQ